MLCRAWEETILSTPLPIAWDVRHQDIVTLECTAAVSPANSFGFMDGGVDLVYSRHFGWHVQERLQKAIQSMKFSELLVGQALAVETDYPRACMKKYFTCWHNSTSLHHPPEPADAAINAQTIQAFLDNINITAFLILGTKPPASGNLCHTLYH